MVEFNDEFMKITLIFSLFKKLSVCLCIERKKDKVNGEVENM